MALSSFVVFFVVVVNFIKIKKEKTFTKNNNLIKN